MNIQIGDVIFVKPSGITGYLITFFDKGSFSHCCIAVNSEEILETDLFTNARIVPFKYKNYEVVKLNLTSEQKRRIPKIAYNLIGLKYDYLLIIYYMLKGIFQLKKPWKLPRHEICSELVDNVLFKIGVISETEFLSGETPNMAYQKLKLLSTNKMKS
jgi:hypothetical protein